MWTHRRSGHVNQRGQNDHRNAYERDRTRVIHCPAFRRLQRKTQILGTNEGDFHRTRLTHSLEVASIGLSIIRNLSMNQKQSALAGLLPNDDLINVICLLHDIGHPPFGHGGETALNYMMRHHGGFEGNGQTLRLLTKLENSYGAFGLDLTRRALLGILKYPVKQSVVIAPQLPQQSDALRINDWLPPKAYFDCEQSEIDWLFSSFSAEDITLFQSLHTLAKGNQHGKSAYYSFDCSIMTIADDIAYGVHDLEDAIHLRLITRSQLDNSEFHDLLSQTKLKEQMPALIDNLFSNELNQRKQAIGEMVNYFITATDIVIINEQFSNVLLKHNVVLIDEASNLLKFLIACVFKNVINSQNARTFEYGGQTVITRLFDAIASNPEHLLDSHSRELYRQADNKTDAVRVICDYITNMTDDNAYRMYQRLSGFNTRSIFD